LSTGFYNGSFLPAVHVVHNNENMYLAAGEMVMFTEFRTQRVEEHLIVNFADHEASFIEHCQYTGVRCLHQIAYHFVVEIIDLDDTL
jgi:hypothetical protein